MAGEENEVIIDGPGADAQQLSLGENMLVDDAGPQKRYTKLDDEDEKAPEPAPEPTKSHGDAEAYARQLEYALRLSEQAREAALRQQAQPQWPQPQQPTVLTPDQIDEMLTKDPKSARLAIRHMIEEYVTPQAQNLSGRMEGLMTGAITLAEAQARQKYPLEFSALQHEIKGVVDQIPDRQGLTSIEGWDRVVDFVRGRHVDKYIEARDRARGTQAQEEQRKSSGFSPRSTARTSQAASGSITDPVTREIMQGLGYDPNDPKDVREWNHWKGR